MYGEERNTEFWWGNRKERHLLKDLGIDGKLKFFFKEQDGRAKSGLIWPCITLNFYSKELLAPRLTLRLVDHPLSAVRDSLLHTFEGTLHIWRPSFPSACRVLVGYYEGKKPLGRPKCRWEDNIKLNLNDTGWKGMKWIHVTVWEQVVGSFEHGIS